MHGRAPSEKKEAVMGQSSTSQYSGNLDNLLTALVALLSLVTLTLTFNIILPESTPPPWPTLPPKSVETPLLAGSALEPGPVQSSDVPVAEPPSPVAQDVGEEAHRATSISGQLPEGVFGQVVPHEPLLKLVSISPSESKGRRYTWRGPNKQNVTLTVDRGYLQGDDLGSVAGRAKRLGTLPLCDDASGPVIVSFAATWCKPCKKEFVPLTEQLVAPLHRDSGGRMIMMLLRDSEFGLRDYKLRNEINMFFQDVNARHRPSGAALIEVKDTKDWLYFPEDTEKHWGQFGRDSVKALSQSDYELTLPLTLLLDKCANIHLAATGELNDKSLKFLKAAADKLASEVVSCSQVQCRANQPTQTPRKSTTPRRTTPQPNPRNKAKNGPPKTP